MSGVADHIKSDVLPSDPVELRTFAEALLERCDRLERLLKLANALRHGPSSERIHPDQLQLGLENIDQAVGEADAREDRASALAREKSAGARRANRGKLPEHLPCVIETLAPAQTICPCCNGALREIGVDQSKRLDIIPA
jgi:transposase